MGQVEHAERHPRRRAVGRDVAQPDRDERRRPIDREVERRHGCAEDLEPLRERRAVPRQRSTVVLALVARELRPAAAGAVRAPLAAGQPGDARRCPGPRRHGRLAARGRRPPSASSRPSPRTQRRASIRGDGQTGSPTQRPGAIGVERPGRQRLAHPGAQHRLVHRPVVDALQPVVEPAHDLGEEVVAGSRHAEVRVGVGPRPDHRTARDGQPGQQARDRVRIAVEPAADGEDGDLDRRVVLAHRPVPPEVVTPLVAEPGLQRHGDLGHPLLPHLAPAVADERRIGRQGEERLEHRAPVERVGEQAAAHVVHVVGVAVVGRARGDDRPELGRPEGGDLQGVEPGPRVADHPDLPGAPRLAGQPGDRRDGVVQLLRQVLVARGSRRTRPSRGSRAARRRSRDRRGSRGTARC